MATYLTRDGDVLDAICWKYYGRVSATALVLQENPGLAERGPVLEAGIRIVLPEVAEQAEQQPISLWD